MFFFLIIGIKKREKSNTKHMLLVLQGVSWIYLNVMETLSSSHKIFEQIDQASSAQQTCANVSLRLTQRRAL